jgi:hypothetical protein
MKWLSVRGWDELAGFSEEDRRVVVRQAARELRRCRPALAMAPVGVVVLGMVLAVFAEMLVPNEAPRFSPEWGQKALILAMIFPLVGATVFGVIGHVVYLRYLRPFVGRVIERAVGEAGKGIQD